MQAKIDRISEENRGMHREIRKLKDSHSMVGCLYVKRLAPFALEK